MGQIKIACAVICEQDDRILMVKETREDEGIVLNQPVGKLELNEDIFEAARREFKEETGLEIELTDFLGTYVWLLSNGNTSIRFCFVGRILGGVLHCKVRDGNEIIEPLWLTRDDLSATENQYRNPVTKQCLEDYFSGVRYPLNIIKVLRAGSDQVN